MSILLYTYLVAQHYAKLYDKLEVINYLHNSLIFYDNRSNPLANAIIYKIFSAIYLAHNAVFAKTTLCMFNLIMALTFNFQL